MDRRQPPHVQAWQAVENEHWPANPRGWRWHEPGIDVRVRIVFERDGETFLDGTARRWDTNHVYVEIDDRRLQINGVWLRPKDVKRQTRQDES